MTWASGFASSAADSRAGSLDGETNHNAPIANHGGAIVVPVGVLAGRATVVVDEDVEGLGLFDDLGGAAPGYVSDVASTWADVDDVGIGFRVLSR